MLRRVLSFCLLFIFNQFPIDCKLQAQEKEVYFGNLHLHTGYSFDAFVGSSWHRPEDAYRYGRGDTIDLENTPLHLARPLDFMAITDHSEYLGVFPHYDENQPNFVADKYKEKEDGSKSLSIWQWIQSFFSMYTHNPVPEFDNDVARKNAWQRLLKLADQYYEPGTFTTFAGFEWTAMSGGFLYARDQHRCVIFRSTKDIPLLPYSQLDSHDPEDLWSWMDRYRQESGADILAIPHNMNRSGGRSFSPDARNNGAAFDQGYASERIFNEPVQEVIQHKGQSMEHPALSPNDEFANFEIWSKMLSLTGRKVKRKELPTSYAQQGFQIGMQIKDELGVNPFQFGIIGSADAHDGIVLREETEYNRTMIQASGIACIWAESNTRETIFDALRRKETYASSGSRIKLRFFASLQTVPNFNFNDDKWIQWSYENGVPMGGDLMGTKKQAPTFLAWVQKDPESANLERLQMIKLWVDAEGAAQQKIYNLAWSGDRTPDDEGKLKRAVTDSLWETDQYDHNRVGEAQLSIQWQDPDFDPDERAAYYLRVLEVPNMFTGLKERAWASPIWYEPASN